MRSAEGRRIAGQIDGRDAIGRREKDLRSIGEGVAISAELLDREMNGWPRFNRKVSIGAVLMRLAINRRELRLALSRSIEGTDQRLQTRRRT